jgi:hypothetical protein
MLALGSVTVFLESAYTPFVKGIETLTESVAYWKR